MDLERKLGEGQYGRVYLAQLIPDEYTAFEPTEGKNEEDIKQYLYKLRLLPNPTYYASKVVERRNLSQT